MKNRTIRAVLYCLIAVLILVACDSDGKSHMYIAFTLPDSQDTLYLKIEDDDGYNNIYVDTSNKLMHCGQGPDKMIKLPPQTQWDAPKHPSISLDAKLVCLMGQQIFDQGLQLLQLSELVPEP